MFLFNLSLAEFLTLFTAASALVTALYFLDRSRRKIAVATLRFWTEAKRPVESTSRRRIRQWPSLLLQLASIACLLLALSQLRIGSRDDASRDHVVILDTSAWMSARAAANGPTLMEEARGLALDYLKALPSTDRASIVYADSITTPATSFESNRRNLETAIRQARPGSAALDLNQALAYARKLQSRGAKQPGEIVFAGAGRLTEADNIDLPPNLRILPVKAAPENVGLRKAGVRHSPTERDLWHVYLSVRNYGLRPRSVDLGVQFAGTPVGTRKLTLAPGAEQEAAFEFRAKTGGPLEARIRAAGDGFAADDRAVMELPAMAAVPVTICTNDATLLRPLFEAHSSVEPVFRSTAQCAAGPQEGLAVYDRFVPATPGKAPAIYIEPPAAQSPVPVKATVSDAILEKWNISHTLGTGLRAQDLRLASTQVFLTGPQDVAVAESSAGPVVVAREQGVKRVVFGFHPMRALRFELSTPLLFANILRWLAPDSFRQWEIFASSVGTVSVPIEGKADASTLRVLAADGSSLPYTLHEHTLRFFAGRPGTVRVIAGDREQVHSLTLPAVPEGTWTAPSSVRRGVPRAREVGSSSTDIWYWLAIAGGLGLLLEWLLFSPSGVIVPAAASSGIRRAA